MRINELLKDENHIVIPEEEERALQDWDEYTDDNDPDFADEFNQPILDDSIPEADETFTPDTFDDKYLHKEILMMERGASTDAEPQIRRVTKRLRDAEGRPIGTAHDNPLLDTREYGVELRDGHSEALSANLIAQHLYSETDEEGNVHVLLDDIVDHKRNENAVDKEDAFIIMKNGVKRRRETTQGWKLLCQWKDGSTNWVALKDMKHSTRLELQNMQYRTGLPMSQLSVGGSTTQ
jgi:hypothetical protein